MRSRTIGISRLRTAALLSFVMIVVLMGVISLSRMAGGVTAKPVAQTAGAAVTEDKRSAGLAGVEVPSVMGLSLQEALVVLEAAGLGHQVRASDAGATPKTSVVVDQDPTPGVLESTSQLVTLTVREDMRSGATEHRITDDRGGSRMTGTICIDPGHQAHADITPEPIGPRSKRTKQRVTGGVTGVTTMVPEYELTLQIATNLKARLESRGFDVVMTRTTSDVNISNAERAMIANRAKADLFVRIHCDGSPDSEAAGVSTLYPAETRWTKAISEPSRLAALRVQERIVATTGAIDRGVVARSNLAGFNWSKVPAILVECGFLSNPVEDRLLASPHYQDKLADGIADGIVIHFGAME